MEFFFDRTEQGSNQRSGMILKSKSEVSARASAAHASARLSKFSFSKHHGDLKDEFFENFEIPSFYINNFCCCLFRVSQNFQRPCVKIKSESEILELGSYYNFAQRDMCPSFVSSKITPPYCPVPD